ncbi:hypothetical protein HDU79_007527 [Rhizoclosmatium sp. JEL0117]|nr:hypothetical protein HDU79_007527 [Rhizoclosmatium sp. JEL0117]
MILIRKLLKSHKSASILTRSTDCSFKKLHPQEFHRRFLGKGVRPDGREGLMSWRTPSIHRGSIATANGSALVRMGGTTVICGIKAEVAVPDTNHPTTGYLVPNVDFPPICGSQFKPTAPGEFTQSVSEMVYRVVKGNNILDLETLCIEGGKAVWVLYADIVFLNYEGNAVDAALLAFTAALKDTKLPVAVYSDVEGTVRADAADRSVSLDVKRVPFGATFGIFEQDGGAKMAMADPTDEEEAVLISSVTVVVDGESQELMGTFGAQVPIDLMDQCIGQAKKRATAIKKL